MAKNAITVTGTLSDNHTIRLDEPVPLPPARVRVTLEPLRAESPRSYIEVMSEIRQRQRARGHRPPLRDEVDAHVLAERDSWGT